MKINRFELIYNRDLIGFIKDSNDYKEIKSDYENGLICIDNKIFEYCWVEENCNFFNYQNINHINNSITIDSKNIKNLIEISKN